MQWKPSGAGAGSTGPPKLKAHTTATSSPATLSGLSAGDLLLAFVFGHGASPGLSASSWSIVYEASVITLNATIALHVVTPQDTSSWAWTVPSPGAIILAAFSPGRSTDGIATVLTGSSAAPATNGFTALLGADVAINCFGWNVTTGTITFSQSTGYTLIDSVPAVAGTSYGSAVEYKTLGAAGAVPGASGAALSASNSWAGYSFGLFNA